MLTQQPKASATASGCCRHLSGTSRGSEALSSQSQVKEGSDWPVPKISPTELLLSDIKSELPRTSFQSLQQFSSLPNLKLATFITICILDLCAPSFHSGIWKTGTYMIFALLSLRTSDKVNCRKIQDGKLSVTVCAPSSDLTTVTFWWLDSPKTYSGPRRFQGQWIFPLHQADFSTNCQHFSLPQRSGKHVSKHLLHFTRNPKHAVGSGYALMATSHMPCQNSCILTGLENRTDEPMPVPKRLSRIND